MGDSHQNLVNSVLFQHADFLIAYKADGVDCHDDDGEPGFFNSLSRQLEQQLFPVHRLDKVTSGLVIMAKHSAAAAQFERLFRERQIEKRYLALAQGKPVKKQGWIKGDMQKSRRGAWKLMRSQNNPAITQFSSTALMEGIRGYLLSPKSGKTHQLRVAMKSLGTPILGDHLYGNKDEMQSFDRTYLHAFTLKFSWNNEIIMQHALPRTGMHFNQEPVTLWMQSMVSGLSFD